MAFDTDTLNTIANGRPVRVFLPLQHRPDRVRAQGVYQKTAPPKFALVFKPGMIPVDDIDLKQPCIVAIDLG